MKIKFDSNQQYQLDAIQAIVDVFKGQPRSQGKFEVDLMGLSSGMFNELGVGNHLTPDEDTILANLKEIQEQNGIPQAEALDGMNFSVEMETGTGKTYVYLRTIHELYAQYGFTKFIIVVPSVAIREGVLKNLSITKEHFQGIYGNQPFDYWVYDSKRVSSLRQFASSNQLQILVINIDAFNKKENNVIHKENDRLSGRKPIEFIQATQPIVIVDEPQNMESTQAKEAIQSLNPLCTLRYSATHRHIYNLLYRLDPVKAYDMKLVKRIEVDSVLEEDNFNQPYIRVESIKATKTKITAKLTIDCKQADGVKRTSVSISKNGTDLYELSGNRELYQGYIVDHIDAGSQYIAFTNGVVLNTGQQMGGYNDDIMKVQIRETVKEHLEKELHIYRNLPEGKRLKVLSLFFIDKVANYDDAEGKIRLWFEEVYQELAFKPRYRELNLPPVEAVHSGYFAQSKGKAKDTSGKTKADDEAYQLIMKDKERLLSLEEPVRFIFSHSALREGWDNPNVFQICTLNETKSEMKKRQEIGRGLRLPVDQTGHRVFDTTMNRLTVVANESYEDFARSLQTEIEEECGVQFEGRIDNKRQRRTANLKKGWRMDENFLALWDRIKYKTRYSVKYQTGHLIAQAAQAIKKMPAIESPKIMAQKRGLEITSKGLETRMLSVQETKVGYSGLPVPDLLSYIQRETELTRSTIAQILINSERLADVAVNPQRFLEEATKAIKETLHSIMIDGIQYERIDGAEYEMLLFADPKHEIRGYVNRMLEVKGSIYDAIEFDSEVEKEFAQNLDARQDIKLFIKLPRWFTVETPLGTYNPDWAIVKQAVGEDEKLYLVSETKSTKDLSKLRDSERDKIECGKRHFSALPEVQFKHVKDASEV
ncbi:type III restriction enzyme, res subunit [Desulforamulus reducens MI-1]|uniref:Type III restriction enzyme, res subunit n=1 Tax=Desulforamulus reducens (strain ATCC BAA-1160 / DSM 100696 / MI-1) TaxID=349161 RepID=A4J1V7_DESRM|nr:DEAD/DEAH box helicase family protein [Desulforamulus reducens]ABO49060.1 type III restriction enzyme, res subunit [Desulforamulus reducens MI-1]